MIVGWLVLNVCSYEEVWKIIDARWDNQLHRPLYVAAYYLNPQFHYEPEFRYDDPEFTFLCMIH